MLQRTGLFPIPARASATLMLCAAIAAGQPAARAAALDEPIRPLPDKLDVDPARVALGKRLFFDTRFSRDNKISCASCHDFNQGGADGRARSAGVDGNMGTMNAPSIFNVAFNFRQFWNGKVATLEEQIDLVVASPNVFGSSWEAILAKLARDDALVQAFRRVYPDGLTRGNATDALVAFERSLVTPSRFDAYLRGNDAAITAEEKQGYARFKSFGCIACHQGINIGGNMFQRFGVMRPYLKGDGAAKDTDLGRYLVTRRESDRQVFKVPSLRNVALTAPYFHDASAGTLEEAVDVMFRHQLGRVASPEDKALIVAFLKSLNGTVPAHAWQGTGK